MYQQSRHVCDVAGCYRTVEVWRYSGVQDDLNLLLLRAVSIQRGFFLVLVAQFLGYGLRRAIACLIHTSHHGVKNCLKYLDGGSC